MQLIDYTRASDFEALGTNLDITEYPETIEQASEDQLRNWLLKLNYTAKELDLMVDSGISLRDLASDMELQGHTFP